MKHLRIAFGLALVAGLMAVSASSAWAGPPRWVACEKVPPGTGHWTDQHCEKAGSGEWDTREITETREVTSDGTLELEDEKASALGATRIKCSGTNLGTVGAGGSDSVVSITATNCEFVKAGGCSTGTKPTAEARNLGWTTQLEEVENKETKKQEVRDRITSLIAGKQPGWAVTCTSVLGKKETDVCESEGTASTKVTNGTGEKQGAVIGTFEKAQRAHCSLGGAGVGIVEGEVLSRLRTGPSGELRLLWVLASAFGT